MYPGCQIVGAGHDASRIPGIDVRVREGDAVQLGNVSFQVLEVPGHTRGHIAYWSETAKALFPGDTLFLMGCGRLFEGTAQQMWSSLQKLQRFPDDTKVFCAHEYTLSNARFAITVDPTNANLQKRKDSVESFRKRGEPTVPATLGEERATNPFLRASDQKIRIQLGFAPDTPDWEVFQAIRLAKDRF
eukprot:CAMPEP_0175063704 /NCGR_PEP_ID=MMETSP0052_2-20121109/14913_1 /TAXON_ID=51329 ORGANISM="Polytomella parva, Strain SAG 63-3" /NCGR_SAMPLE_ID=MMETSP0052_2 /ASSEMBLY_ACC=CAM_ASM_000194 /LENGTH=187 /DNA_ID=CAMNT_0016329949 /DNA_START=485 /DNA_END=1048 /DNA_ORIENTATION=+